MSFRTPPNFETKHRDFDGNLTPEDVASALYIVDVVITTIWINLQNQPEAPEVRLERDPGFYILTTERSQLRDTGYRV